MKAIALLFLLPHFSWADRRRCLNRNAFCAASVGPDMRDSLIVYYPFPGSLAADASAYGINSVS